MSMFSSKKMMTNAIQLQVHRKTNQPKANFKNIENQVFLTIPTCLFHVKYCLFFAFTGDDEPSAKLHRERKTHTHTSIQQNQEQ